MMGNGYGAEVKLPTFEQHFYSLEMEAVYLLKRRYVRTSPQSLTTQKSDTDIFTVRASASRIIQPTLGLLMKLNFRESVVIRYDQVS